MWTTNQGSGFSVQGSAAKGRSATNRAQGSLSPHHPFTPSPAHSPACPGAPGFPAPPTAYHLLPTPRAFTLTELLVVITIIGMLAAISATYLLKGWNTAKQARTTAEVTNLASAMEEFRRAYGDYPPSYLDHKDPNAFALMVRFLAKAFPRCNPNVEVWYIPWCDGTNTFYAYPSGAPGGGIQFWSPGGAAPNSPQQLTPSQALVFWLTSISKDPAHPLSAATSDRVSFFDFAMGRLSRMNSTGTNGYSNSGSGWSVLSSSTSPALTAPPPGFTLLATAGSCPVYNPSSYLPQDGNQQGYVYFEARCYLFHALFQAVGNFYPPQPTAAKPYPECNPPVPYLSRSAPWNVDTTNSNLTASSTGDVITDSSQNIIPQSFTSFQKLCVNPQSFQIIAAGLDNDFGLVNSDTPNTRGTSPGVVARPAQVMYSPTGSTPLKCYLWYKSYPDGQGYDTITNADDDNITNFSESPLGSQKAQ